jgi:hypothetical protein
VPTDSSPLGFAQPTANTVAVATDPGLTTPGLIDPATLASDAGLATPGLPASGGGQSVSPSAEPSYTGLTLNPDGTVSGTFRA